MNGNIATKVLFVTLLVLVAPAVSANPISIALFELTDRPYSLDIPPNGSLWHSLAGLTEPSALDVTVVQEEYTDAGDALVSGGDIILGWVGALRQEIGVMETCRLYRLLECGWIVGTRAPYVGTPVGETWLVIDPYELWGTELVVQAWDPAGSSGLPEAGDRVRLDNEWLTIEWARLGVQGYYAQAISVRESTWSRIKSLYGENR